MTDQKVHGQAQVKSTYNTSLEPELKITIEWSPVRNHELLRKHSPYEKFTENQALF